MINLLNLCILLLFLLIINLVISNKEGLDNCNPPIQGSTTTGMTNTAHIQALQDRVDNISNSHLDSIQQQLSVNTGNIKNLTDKLKDFSTLQQSIANLKVLVKQNQQAMKNLGGQIQQAGYSSINAGKDGVKKPLPQATGITPYTG